MKISVLLEMLTANFETDAKRAEKLFAQTVKGMEETAKRAGVAIGAGLASTATALGVMAQQAIQAADKIGEASQRTGVATEALSRLKHAAEQSGTSFEAIEKGLQKLAREADSGGKNLARIGVSAEDLQGRMRPVEAVLLDVADRFAGMGNATEKAAAAQAIFGKAGSELIPLLSEGKAGIQALGDEAERLGIVFSQDAAEAAGAFNDNLDKLKDAALGLGNDIASELLPALLDVTTAAVNFVQQIREDGTLRAWIDGIKEAAGYIDELAVFIATRLVAGALVSLIATLATTATSFSIATAAANTFRLALALAGGPIGIAVTAFAALAVAAYDYESASDRAAQANASLVRAVDLLKEAQGAGLRPAILAAEAQRDNAKAALEAASADLAAAEARVELNRQMMASLQIGPRGEPGAQAAVGGAAIAYSVSASRAEELRKRIEELRGTIAGANEEIDGSKKRLSEWEERLRALNQPTVSLGKSTAELAEEQKRAAEAARELAEEQERLNDWNRQLADSADDARDAMADMAARLAADIGGPAVAAWQEYQRTLSAVEENLAAIRRAGPATAEELALAAKIGQDAWQKYQGTLEDIRKQEEEAADRADTVANRVRDAWTQAADQMSYAWGDLLTGQLDDFDDFADAIKDIWLRALADMIAAQSRSGFADMLGSMFGGGGTGSATAGGGFGNILGSLFGGGGAGGGGFGGIFGSLFGGSSGAAGMNTSALIGAGRGGVANAFAGAGGGSAAGGMMGGAMGFMGQAAPWAVGLHGIRTGNVGQGVVGGSMAGMQVGGPWGALVGAIIGGLGAAFNKPKPPDFRLGGSASNVRKPEGDFDTVFGNVRAGSRLISWESLVEPVQQFDSTIRDLILSMGGGQDQLDSISAALSRWSVDLKDDAATAENVLGSRFGAILSTFSTDVQEFVGNAGTVQERVGKLADALAIEQIVELGTIGDTFDAVADLLTDYRDGTESLADTYARVAASAGMFDAALDIMGVAFEGTRDELIRFAADITEAAGSLERAQALWTDYFETFYSAQERAQLTQSQAESAATREFGDIGLSLGDFTGQGGAAAFRQMFEQMLPTLSAEAVVQWLEAANALGVLIDATAALSGASTEGAAAFNTLAELMAGVKEDLGAFAPPADFAQRYQQITASTQDLIDRAMALGATEQDIATIRELGQLRLNALLEEQNDLIAERQAASDQLAAYLGNLSAEAAGGITPLTSEMQRLRGEYDQHIERINELAIASGRAGASQEELAVATAWYSQQVNALVAELIASAQSIIARLYGRAGAASASVGTSTWTGGGGDIGGIQQVADAVDDRYRRELQYLAQINDWLESLRLSALSPLTPEERLTEARSTYEDLLSRAQGGDLDAMERLQGAAQNYLQEAQGFFGGVGAYRGIFEDVESALRALVDRGALNPVPEPGTGSTGGGSGSSGGMVVEAGESFVQLSELERYTLAEELVGILRDLVAASGDSLTQISEQLGLDLRDLVTDLGVNLDDVTLTTTLQLADISRNLGVDLSELATSVGLDLGALGDEQSLLNDALEDVIDEIPEEFRERIRGYLEDIEEATRAGNAAPAVRDAEEAINQLPASIRDLLAPFFGGVGSPTDQLLQITVEQASDIAAIRALLEAPPPDPSAESAAKMAEVSASSNVVDFQKWREESEQLRASVDRGNKQVAALLAENNEIQRRIASGVTGAPQTRNR